MANHAIERAAERYGVVLTKNDLRAPERRITAGESVLIERMSHGERRVVVHQGQPMIFVWGTHTDGRRIIVTFLPPETVHAGAHRAHFAPTHLKRGRRSRQRWEGGRYSK